MKRTLKRSFILILLFFNGFMETLQKNSGYDCYKPIKLNKTKLEDEIKVISEAYLISITVCSTLSSRTSKANAFCFQDGNCQVFFVIPCQVSFDVASEDTLTCYSTIDFEAIASVYRRASYHKLVGCWWFTTESLMWEESNDKCKEDGGQLATLENFKTQEELQSFDGLKSIEFRVHVGFRRNGLTSEFKWLSGKILNINSFMWNQGEPNNNEEKVVCGCGYNSMVIDDYCDKQILGLCHILSG